MVRSIHRSGFFGLLISAGIKPPVVGRFVPAFQILAIALLWGIAGIVSPRAADQTLEIASKNGVHVFSVEFAVTEEERERGLMFRKELAEGHGMLFEFKQEQQVSMWMQNTYIPLDMIFIRGDGHILRIAENTEPLSTRIISSGGPVRWVLEVGGGTAKKLGLVPGDQVAGSVMSGH